MGCQAHTEYQKLQHSAPLYWRPLNIWRLLTRGRIFVKFLLCFYFWNLFSFYCWGSVPTEVWRYLRESQSHPCCQIYKEMMKYHSFPAIGHGFITTLFSNTFHNSFFFEKMWSNLRRQTIRWSITSALPNYWLGHKEGRKVGFCQILYIWHLFKMCLMYFLCMSSHSFCASTRGWHFTQKEMMSGPQIFGRNPFFYPKLIPETVNFEMGFFLEDDWLKGWRYLSFVIILLRQADMLCLKI